MSAPILRTRSFLLGLSVVVLMVIIIAVVLPRTRGSAVTITFAGYATNQAGLRGLTYVTQNHTEMTLALRANLSGGLGSPDAFTSLPPSGEARLWLSVGSNPPPHRVTVWGYAPAPRAITWVIQYLEKRNGRSNVDVSRIVFEISPPAVTE